MCQCLSAANAVLEMFCIFLSFFPKEILKGALCSFGEEIWTLNFNIYRFNEVIIQTQKYFHILHRWINKLFTEEKKVPQCCLVLERWQGPPHLNKVKQFELVLFFKICFFQSWKQRESVNWDFFPKTTACAFNLVKTTRAVSSRVINVSFISVVTNSFGSCDSEQGNRTLWLYGIKRMQLRG